MNDVQTLSPEAFAALLLSRAGEGRFIAALAGAPGSGKSTAAEAVAAAAEAEAPGALAVLPMDGFHFDDIVLEARGWRARKGAPHTFDVGGLAALIRRLRADEEDEIAMPVFDRSIEIARAGARIAPRSARVILVEGNYLLLRDAPWSGLAPLFDLTAATACRIETIERRLRARWEGAALPEAEITRRVEANDLPNARLVLERSAEPDIRIRTEGA